MRQRFRVIAAVAMTSAMTVVGVGTAAADPPSESGAVTRFEEAGFAAVRADTNVDGEVRDVIALFNLNSTADICTGNLAQAASVQGVDPDDLGRAAFHRQVTDRDVPVLLFDVTGLGVPPGDEPAFVALVCGPQQLAAFASGSANIRDRLTFNDAVFVNEDAFWLLSQFSANGSVTDGDTEWRLQVKSRDQISSKTGVERLTASIRLH